MPYIFFYGAQPRNNPTGGRGEAQSTPPPDPPATFGRANARFPNWGLVVLVVIFWLTPCTKMLTSCFYLI